MDFSHSLLMEPALGRRDRGSLKIIHHASVKDAAAGVLQLRYHAN